MQLTALAFGDAETPIRYTNDGDDTLLSASAYCELTEAELALLPFMAWAAPLINDERHRVLRYLNDLGEQHAGCLDAARLAASVNTAFARPVLGLCHRTLVLELAIARHQRRLCGDTPQMRFKDFLDWLTSADGRTQLDKDYPPLRESVSLRAQQVERTLTVMLERLVADHAQIAALMPGVPLGRLQSFKTQMGDRHADGCSVARLRFEHGCIYYKPRPMAVDVAFGEFLGLLQERGVGPGQRVPAVLDRGSYGYAAEIEYLEADSEDALRAFYRRYGGLVAITHILGATDLHFENLIASGAYPVIIDAESLFQPSEVGRRSKTTSRLAFADTVIYSRLLPMGDDRPGQSDISALSMPQESLQRRAPVGAGTDNLRLCVVKVDTPFATNVPRLGGQAVQTHQYTDEIVEGFDATYRGLMLLKHELLRDNGPLATFKGLSVRMIVRSTETYAHLLRALTHPEYLSSSEKREELVRKIRPGTHGSKVYRRCWPSERVALLRGDVPYFMARINSRDVQDDRGGVMRALVGSSAWNESRRRIRRLSPSDLYRQSRLVQQAVFSTRDRASLERWSDHCPAQEIDTFVVPFQPAAFIAEARCLGDRILASGFGNAGHVEYFQLSVGNGDTFRLFPLEPSLYNGLAGLAIFLGELWRQTDEVRYLRAAETTIASARRAYAQSTAVPDAIGAFDGISGWVYTLTLLGQRLDRREWVEEATSWLPWIAERIEKDCKFDVMSGAAGALLVLTELDRVAPGRGALAVARACAAHLLAAAVQNESGASWICAAHPHEAVTGFSHGTAGIAAALARFAVYAGEPRYLALANDAIQFERATYDGYGWRDVRKSRCDEHGNASHPYAWCHGAPGIGLGRAILPQVMRDAAWLLDVERCARHTRQHGFGGSHCLCHGQLGNLEFFMHLQPVPQEREDFDSWHAIASQVLDEGRTTGWRTGSVVGHDLLGFMTGLAGIGYALLRTTDPQGIPSVSALELC